MDRLRTDAAGCAPSSGAPTPRLVAQLVYDTDAKPLPTGVRAVVQRARRLLFAADGLEIVLQVSPEAAPERLKLLGQVLAKGLPLDGATIRLRGAAVLRDRTDRDGAFRFGELARGSYALEIDGAEQVIDVQPLNLGAA